jgi:uncharacterized membrane protein
MSIETLILFTMAGAYVLLGINHFWHPRFYLPMFPPYIPKPKVINTLAGIAEIVLGVGLMIEETRSWAAMGIIAMLIAFTPVHVYMIQKGGKFPGGARLPLWAAWVRLVVIHPILIFAAWWFV